jgi:hypothetical protein
VGSSARQVRETDNLTAICEQIVYVHDVRASQENIGDSKAYYGDSFTIYISTVNSNAYIGFVQRKVTWKSLLRLIQ